MSLAISVLAENVLIGTSYTFAGTSYELIWVNRAPFIGNYLKLPTVVGTSFDWVGTSYKHCTTVLVKYVENYKKNQKNAKLILLALYFHALYNRTMKCII